MGPFKPLFPQWQQIIIAAAVLSMAWGAFAALRQPNIKRLMAYSSIGNVGYVLLGLAAGSEKGIQAVRLLSRHLHGHDARRLRRSSC